MSDVSARLSALSSEKRALLERALLERRNRETATVPTRDRSIPAPLSATQQRLWFHDQLSPGATTYNAVVAMWVDGELDVDLLEAAVRDSVDRHEIVRSVIDPGEDEPVQRVLDDWHFEIRRLRSDDDATAVDLAREFAGRPYDLACDLTLRVAVVEVSPRRWLAVFGQHHIAFDGWSDDVLFGEVSEFYNLRAAPDRSPLPLQFADFATWQRERLERDDLALQLKFWTSALDGAPPVLALPLDAPRPDRQTFHGRHLPIAFAHADGVRSMRSALGGTDFMILVSAWAAVLYRWTGQSDIVFSTPMANRSRRELETLIGFFSNTVPLRVRVDGGQRFSDLVSGVISATLNAFDNQDVPFERIVEAVSPERDPRINPLSQVNVRVQSGPLPALRLDGLDVQPVHIDLGFARFDLAVEFQMGFEDITGYLEYNVDLFTAETARSLLQRMDMLLAAVIETPDIAVWDIPQPTSARQSRRRSASGSS